MIVEQRTYSLAPGGTTEYLKAYNELGRAVQADILGGYQSETGELNQIVFLWAFDSADERARRRDQLMADPRFTAFRKLTRHLLLRQESRLLRAV